MNSVKAGAKVLSENICEFILWAPFALSADIEFVFPEKFIVSMSKCGDGYWKKTVEGIRPGFRYFYLIDGTLKRPDPASVYQPDGVHGPSEVVDHTEFSWDDTEWKAPHLENMIIYEIHTGTFTREGTLDAIIPVLDDLKELGVTTIELMPVAQFPGNRNWGYDGVYPYAVHNSYGGPDALKRLCNACHKSGIAVFLDVVYNHLGPEGNYLSAFGPYFTGKYRSPWSEAINFDGEYSDGVRNYFIMNALNWFRDYHVDGLRLDAVHSIYDISGRHILQELSERVKKYAESAGRDLYLIAESDLNDSRIVRNIKSGGYGIDAQWSDDFHHAVHALITGESSGYYVDFGGLSHVAKAFTHGYVYNGEYSQYRKRRHGNSSADLHGHKMIAFIQNHDQTGNRMSGERLTKLAGFEAHKLAAGVLMTAPYVPMLFMGEEYADTAPFLYFISHGDPELVDSVRRGRKLEFKFSGSGYDPPDPQSPETFEASMPDRTLADNEPHSAMLNYYKKLIAVRKENPAMHRLSKKNLAVHTDGKADVLIVRRIFRKSEICAVMNFSGRENICNIGENGYVYEKLIDSADREWAGCGASAPSSIDENTAINLKPFNFIIYSVRLVK
jgi:maltooligosyltrehalose trehalohydrolase